MSEKKRSLNITNVLGAVLIIVLVALSVLLGVYIQQNTTLQDKNNQIASLQNQLATPKLIIFGLQYTDNRSDAHAPFLHITGYVVNVGSAKANMAGNRTNRRYKKLQLVYHYFYSSHYFSSWNCTVAIYSAKQNKSKSY